MKVRADAQTTTRNARRNLKPRPKPYLRNLAQGIAIGYRKKAKDGVWTASLYLGNGRYRETTIGAADDVLDADGLTVLDFEQARKAVLAQIEAWRAESKAATNGGIQTIRTAIEAYVSGINNREDAQNRARRDAQRRFKQHVLNDPIADLGLHTLTESDLTAWLNRRPAHLKSASLKRIASDLKAALNVAAKRYRSALPAEIGVIVRHGLAVEGSSEPIARDDAALPDADIRRILAAAAEVDAEEGWEGDLHRMVAVLAATGTRFSQAARVRVGDLQAEKGRLMVPVSRKGRGRKPSTHVPIRIGEDVVSLLLPAVRGRKPDEPLLQKWLHSAVNGKWQRTSREAWKFPSELRRPWSAILEKAGLPADTVIYAIRHSSIVRQLKAGLPVRLVAALHDTSTVMIERHYSSSIASMLDDVAARAIIPLVETGERKVVALNRGTIP